jgi:hypothetical protein
VVHPVLERRVRHPFPRRMPGRLLTALRAMDARVDGVVRHDRIEDARTHLRS